MNTHSELIARVKSLTILVKSQGDAHAALGGIAHDLSSDPDLHGVALDAIEDAGHSGKRIYHPDDPSEEMRLGEYAAQSPEHAEAALHHITRPDDVTHPEVYRRGKRSDDIVTRLQYMHDGPERDALENQRRTEVLAMREAMHHSNHRLRDTLHPSVNLARYIVRPQEIREDDHVYAAHPSGTDNGRVVRVGDDDVDIISYGRTTTHPKSSVTHLWE